jgi:surfactin synthase thioesterase subunit
VEGLFLSASQNPGDFPEKNIFNSSSEDDMLELMGCRDEKYNIEIRKQFKKVFLPIITNDLMICRKCKFDKSYNDINSIILYGRDDKFTDVDKVKQWDKYVKSILVKGFKGDHFYLDDMENRNIILNLINDYIEQQCYSV